MSEGVTAPRTMLMSDWYAMDLGTARGLSEETVVRLCYIDVLERLSAEIMRGHDPLFNLARFEVQRQRLDLRVVLHLQTVEAQG